MPFFSVPGEFPPTMHACIIYASLIFAILRFVRQPAGNTCAKFNMLHSMGHVCNFAAHYAWRFEVCGLHVLRVGHGCTLYFSTLHLPYSLGMLTHIENKLVFGFFISL